MNCSQARTLFSSYIDGDLCAKESVKLESHLDTCLDCDHRWAAMQRTVELVRALPHENPDPSFVGRVLDRVRAYEAGEHRPIPLSEDELGLSGSGSAAGQSSPAGGILVAARNVVTDAFEGIVSVLRRPVPVLAGGALVAGAAVMALVLQADVNPLDGSVAGVDRTAGSSAAVQPMPVSTNSNGSSVSPSVDPRAMAPAAVSGVASSSNPFEGIADDLELRAAQGTPDDAEYTSPVRVYSPDVWSQTGVQQVNASYDRPRITF